MNNLTPRQIVSLERAREIRGLRRLAPPHPRDFIQAEMFARGWTLRELASRMEGDALRTQAALSLYFRHPTGVLELGCSMAHRLGAAFGLSADIFLDLERHWLRASAVGAA